MQGKIMINIFFDSHIYIYSILSSLPGLKTSVDVSSFAIFLAGLLSFLSPCVLPIIPLYLAYLSGGTSFGNNEDLSKKDKMRNKMKLMLNSFSFILGICMTYFLLALATSTISFFIVSNKDLFKNITGTIILLLGVMQLYFCLRKQSFGAERRINFDWSKFGMNPLVAFGLGFTFSFAWTPCVGPQLAAVLSMSATTGDRARSFIYLAVYCLGFIIPFILLSIFTDSLLGFIKKNRKLMKYVPIFTSILMIIFAILILTSLIHI